MVGSLLSRCAFALMLPLLLLASAPTAAQAPPTGVPAGVMVLTNGDRLTGTLTGITAGKVSFHSALLGDLSVPLERIGSLRTAQPFAVIGPGQPITPATPAAAVPQGIIVIDHGVLRLERSGAAALTLAPAQVQYVVAAAALERQLHGRAGAFSGWSGALTGGAALVAATQNSRTFTGGAALVRSAPGVTWLPPRNRTSFDFSAAYGAVTTTIATSAATTRTNILHAALEQDWYLTPRLFTLAVTSFDHNYSQGLSLQQIYGGGAGYTAVKNAQQELDLKTDVHFERQRFSATPGVVPPVVSPAKNLVGMDFGDAYRRGLMHGITLNQTLTLTPAFNQTKAASALAAASLLFPVHNRFSFNLAAQDAFLNDPGFGSRKNSFQLTAGVGYSLK